MAAIAFDAEDGVPVWPDTVWIGCIFRIAPTMKYMVPNPIAEMNSDILRPTLSIKNTMVIVTDTALTTP